MPTEDVEIIKDNLPITEHILPRFKFIDDRFIMYDERLCDYEGGADMFSWKEVKLEIDDYNHFWWLAKWVQIKKMKINF